MTNIFKNYYFYAAPVQGLRNVWEAWAGVRAVDPALHQHVLDLLGGGEVGEGGLHAAPHLPDDRLGRLLLPRPLPRQQLVPHRAEGVHITRPEYEQLKHDFHFKHRPKPCKRKIIAALLMNSELPDDLWSQVTEPASRYGHTVGKAGHL